MKILLINPPSSNDNSQIWIPLNLLILRQIGLRNNYDIDILDLDFMVKNQGVSIHEIYSKLVKTYIEANNIEANNIEVVGLTTNCANYPISLELAKFIKHDFKNIKIIFGGPHSTLVYRETMNAFDFVDIIIVGEGELAFADLLNNKFERLNEIKGIIFRKRSGEIIETKRRDLISNLDEIEVNLNEELIIKYWEQMKKNEIPVFPIEIGRGCPYSCSYCCASYIWKRRYRVKSPKKIVSEIKFLKEIANIDSFNFTHDNLTFNREYTIELCERLIDENIDVRWNCSSRIDQLDHEVLIKMKQAGCESIFFGIESGSQSIQKRINKNIKIYEVIPVLSKVKQIGIKSTVSFIIGFPYESREDIEATLNLAILSKNEGANVDFNILSPMPKTKIFEEFKNNIFYSEEIMRKLWYIDKELSLYKFLLTEKEIFSYLYSVKHNEFNNAFINYIYFVAMIVINNLKNKITNGAPINGKVLLNLIECQFKNQSIEYKKDVSKLAYFDMLYKIYNGSGD